MYEFDDGQQYHQQEDDEFDFGSTNHINADGNETGANNNYGGYSNEVFEED